MDYQTRILSIMFISETDSIPHKIKISYSRLSIFYLDISLRKSSLDIVDLFVVDDTDGSADFCTDAGMKDILDFCSALGCILLAFPVC